MILAGDIGGTNTRLALFEAKSGRLEPHTELTYPSREHASLDEIVVSFVAQAQRPIEAACFGIAGPVKDGRAATPNLAWIVEAQSLARALKLQRVFLLNDLESIAYGTAALGPGDYAVVSEGVNEQGNRAVIAAGTGLGEAGLFWDGATHRPMASEGGHADFAPRTPIEIELLQFLTDKFGRVSYERILSGPGLHNVYQFLRDARHEPEPAWLAQEISAGDAGAVITSNALAGKSPLCEHTLDLFMQIYGAEAGNCALRFTALGGLFIAGGIAPHLLVKFKEPAFMQAFASKGRMKSLLEAIPVKVVTNGQVGLIGAAHFAARSVPPPLGAAPAGVARIAKN